VAEAVHRFLVEVGSTPGRGGHRLALEAGRLALGCRQAVTRILGLGSDPSRVAFCQNATQALNTALAGVLRSGDAVVVTAFDHNAVLRPVHRLASERGVEVRMVEGDAGGNLDLDGARMLLDGARLLVVNGASNVLGTPLPVGDLSAMAHEAGALVLVDAAQWGGHFEESLADLGADLVAFTGHKALLGPQGIGGCGFEGDSRSIPCSREAREVIPADGRCPTPCRTAWRPDPPTAQGWRGFWPGSRSWRRKGWRHSGEERWS
jgi:cysteine desulfurase / selenocysteine lyase